MERHSHLIESAHAAGIVHMYVGVIALFEGRMLLIQRGRSAVDFPGFYVVPSAKWIEGESLNQTLQKALVLEAELELVSVEGFVGHFDFHRNNTLNRQFIFSATVSEPHRLHGGECSAYTWVPIKEAVGYEIPDGLRDTLNALLSA